MPGSSPLFSSPIVVALLVLSGTHAVDASLALAACIAGSPSQLFAYDAVHGHITVKGSPSQCLMVATGCCDGELIRAGSVLNVDACEADYESQKLSWPSASTEWLLRPTSTQGEPSVSVLPNNATLVFDARGFFFEGALLLGGARSLYSSFYTTPDGHIVNNATGLCVSTTAAPASIAQPLNLQPCASRKQVPLGSAASTQLFALDATNTRVLTSEGLCVTAERALDAFGAARVITASCATAAIPSQVFNVSVDAFGDGRLVAAALPGAPAADAGAGTWWGARVPLSSVPNAATSAFSWAPVGGNASLGVLTHAATGLCLDSGGVPAGHGCLDTAVRGLPFCNDALPFDARVADLVARLTIDEATSMTGDAGNNLGPCGTVTAPIPRLDITPYRWLVEVSSMAGSATKCSPLARWGAGCPTSFPAAMLLSSAFNRTLWRQHGVVVGNEMRVLSNIATTSLSGDTSIPSLAGHGPDINQPRDPRNGRNGELSSEDPFVSGAFATEYVLGMQWGAAGKKDVNSTTRRMLASLKHYNAYSRETDRMGSVGNVSLFDLWDTYLPMYEMAMKDSLAAGTMCSYFSMRITDAPNAPGGAPVYVPSCADPYLLDTIVRQYWERPDATHLSDCGAVINMVRPRPQGNGFVSLNNFSGAAAVAINAGMDQNSNTISPSHLWEALASGLTTPATVYGAAARVLAQRFRLGHFSSLESTPAELLALGAEDIGTAEARAAADEGVRQGATLLRNVGGRLPLRRGSRVAVVGPTALSATAALGDLYGPSSAICADDSNACWPLVGPAIAHANAGGATTVVAGVSMLKNDSSWGDALASIDGADTVVLTLGTDRSVAGEGSDRSDIGLPGVQEEFALAVLSRAAAATPPVPVVLLLIHNLPVSFDALVAPGVVAPVAIVDAWAPTSHAAALAELLFGAGNGFGRAPLTVYPRAYTSAVALDDMRMSPGPGNAGRSYRFYDNSAGAPLVRFGEGLSGFSTFALACSGGGAAPAGGAVAVDCNVSHIAGPDGDEVVMLFHRPGPDVIAAVGSAHPLPLSALRDFARVAVSEGAVVATSFVVAANASLTFTNENGARVLYPGTHFVDAWNGNGQNVTLTFTVITPGGAPLVVAAPPLPW